MIQALQKDDVLLADIESAPDDRLHLWWLGQSGFLVRHGRDRFLFDPYLSETLTQKYAKTDKPHVRMTEQVIDPQRLTGIRAVTSSHAHTDHLDHGSLLPLREANPGMKLILPRAIRELTMDRLGDWEEGFCWMNAGESVNCGNICFRAVPAAHNDLKTDDLGNHYFLGYVVTIGPWSIYFSGDTLPYTGMKEAIGNPVDIAILPINGNKPERRVAGNCDGAEAARLAKDIGAETVIPCHYEMFEFNTASPELFEESCRELNQPFTRLQAGERFSYKGRNSS
ncbi:MAG: MBL fold metallo-hydrolase [Verrucomicrobiota bacterium]